MFKKVSLLTLVLVIFCIGCKNSSEIVYPKSNGKLVYKSFDSKGNTIPDFSMCGYLEGGVKLPDVPVKITIEPGDGIKDDLPRIQKALDKISQLPVNKNGFRGALLLKKGKYVINNPIKIASNGITLRGEGQGKNGTILYAGAKKRYSVINLSSLVGINEITDTKTSITDVYVPIGATQITIENASEYSAGDKIILTRKGTEKWLEFIGMNNLTELYNNPKLRNWDADGYTFKYNRKITAIEGNKITMNAPVVEPIDQEFGGGFITKAIDHCISQCGIENLRIVSYFDRKNINRNSSMLMESPQLLTPKSEILIYQDMNHADIGISVSNAINCWVRNITTEYVANSAVRVNASTNITVQDCAMLDPVAETRGGTKYSFVNGGQLCLFQRLYSRNARHDYTLAPRRGGPNVFLHCFADNSLNASESHHRYGHGGLYDSCILKGGGKFLAVNRGNSGSGHGWAGAMILFWNCGAGLTAIMKPPTSQNFSIGWSADDKMMEETQDSADKLIGWLKIRALKIFEYKGEPIIGDGYIEYTNKQVEPYSLYLQQLENRLGKKAVENIIEPWQSKPVDSKYTPIIGRVSAFK